MENNVAGVSGQSSVSGSVLSLDLGGIPRYASISILYNGKSVGMEERLKSLNYTDNSSGTSDEIILTFERRDADWLRYQYSIDLGSDLDVTIWFHHWNKAGELQKYHCGNFTIDDITFSAVPRQCIVRGVSVPAADSFQGDPISKTWEQITLKQIAQEKMEKYGMSDLFYWGEEPVIETVEQSMQPDSTFLSDLCSKQGMFLKIYKKALVIFDKAVYEAWDVVARFTETDFENWDWNCTLSGTYTGATISYMGPKPEKRKKGQHRPVIDITVGQGPRLLHINEKADDEAEALRIAKAKVNAENEKAITLSFTAVANPNVVATSNIEVYGMGLCDGKYFVERVVHTVSGSGGSSMKVSAYRIFNRL